MPLRPPPSRPRLRPRSHPQQAVNRLPHQQRKRPTGCMSELRLGRRATLACGHCLHASTTLRWMRRWRPRTGSSRQPTRRSPCSRGRSRARARARARPQAQLPPQRRRRPRSGTSRRPPAPRRARRTLLLVLLPSRLSMFRSRCRLSAARSPQCTCLARLRSSLSRRRLLRARPRGFHGHRSLRSLDLLSLDSLDSKVCSIGSDGMAPVLVYSALGTLSTHYPRYSRIPHSRKARTVYGLG